jgi:spore coat-associated protein N
MDDLLLELESGDGSGPSDRSRRRRFAATAAICGMAFIGLGQLTTGALFEDNAASNFTYTTGQVKILAGGGNAFSLKAIANAAPGDTNYSPVTISNAGSLDLRYAITGTSADEVPGAKYPLSDVVEYNVYSVTSPANCSKGGIADSSSQLLTSSPVKLPPSSSTDVVGNPQPGPNPGDRTIGASGSDNNLCITSTLPIDVNSNYAAESLTATFTFNAEQTDNNS